MRRGKLTPAWWTSNQYGLLKSFKITHSGVFIDEEQASKKTLRDFDVASRFLTLRFAVEERDGRAGGLSIFGKQFGDFAQDIGVRIGYNA
jgi:predicted transcriptional regulator